MGGIQAGNGERSTGLPVQHMLCVPYKGHTRWADPEKGTLDNDEYLSLFLYLSIHLSIYLSIYLLYLLPINIFKLLVVLLYHLFSGVVCYSCMRCVILATLSSLLANCCQIHAASCALHCTYASLLFLSPHIQLTTRLQAI